MKLIDVINIAGIFREIQEVTLPMKTSYKIAKFLKLAQVEIEFFETKYKETLEEYKTKEGAEVLENNNVKMTKELSMAFDNRINELAAVDTDVVLELTEQELEPCQLKISQMMVLMPFIK